MITNAREGFKPHDPDSIKSKIYEMLVDYGMDANWFSMWQQGTFTDETGELHRLEAVWGRKSYEEYSPNLFQLLMRLTEMVV